MPEFGERIEYFLTIFLLLTFAARLRRLFRLGRFLFAPDVVEHGNLHFVCHRLLTMPEKTCCAPDGSSPASSQKQLIRTSVPLLVCGQPAMPFPHYASAWSPPACEVRAVASPSSWQAGPPASSGAAPGICQPARSSSFSVTHRTSLPGRHPDLLPTMESARSSADKTPQSLFPSPK